MSYTIPASWKSNGVKHHLIDVISTPDDGLLVACKWHSKYKQRWNYELKTTDQVRFELELEAQRGEL